LRDPPHNRHLVNTEDSDRKNAKTLEDQDSDCDQTTCQPWDAPHKIMVKINEIVSQKEPNVASGKQKHTVGSFPPPFPSLLLGMQTLIGDR
jgi:hypothetical protein